MAGGGLGSLNSLPKHYGYMAALWAGLPAFFLFLAWLALEGHFIQSMVVGSLPAEIQAMSDDEIGLYYNQLVGYAQGSVDRSMLNEDQIAAANNYQQLVAKGQAMKFLLVGSLAVLGGMLATIRVSPELRARNHVENIFKWILFSCSFIAVLTTLGIVLSVLFEAIRFFQVITISDFLLGLQWSPQMAIRADQVGASGSFGFVPLLVGTLLISFVAMFIAVPIGLMSAIYLSEYASRRFRAITKPVLEILAGVPTVVYGFFAALTVAPLYAIWEKVLGLQ